MTRSQRYGIRSLKADFPDDTACLTFMFDALHSRKCSCGGTNKLLPRSKQYYCTKCRKQTAVLSGTIFERSLVPVQDWFYAALLIRQGEPITAIASRLGVGYKTAWRIQRLLRGSTVSDTITICRTERNIGGSIVLKTKSVSTPHSGNGIKKIEKHVGSTPKNIARETTTPIQSEINNAPKIYALKLYIGTAEQYLSASAAEKQPKSFWHLTTLTASKGRNTTKAFPGIVCYQQSR